MLDDGLMRQTSEMPKFRLLHPELGIPQINASLTLKQTAHLQGLVDVLLLVVWSGWLADQVPTSLGMH